MSGLCGWLADSPEFIAVMAAPLSRFDESPLQTRTSLGGSVAVAACDGASHLYQQDGLLVALWGHPVLDGSALNVAQRLAPIWLARGAAACAALSGEFALAIVDGASGQLLLAVDRAGSYPLSYVDHAQGVFFASSNDALLAHPAVRGALDPQALYHYLFFHMVPAPETPWLGWQRLLPGEYLHVCAGKQCKGSYWSLAFQEKTIDTFASRQQAFLRTLRLAVQSSLGDAAASTGAFLSGGTDSSTIAAIVRQVTGSGARAYSIGFDAPGYDEMAYARLAASHAGCVHREY